MAQADRNEWAESGDGFSYRRRKDMSEFELGFRWGAIYATIVLAALLGLAWWLR